MLYGLTSWLDFVIILMFWLGVSFLGVNVLAWASFLVDQCFGLGELFGGINILAWGQQSCHLGKPQGAEIQLNLLILNFKWQFWLSWGQNTPSLSVIELYLGNAIAPSISNIFWHYKQDIFINICLVQLTGGLILTRSAILEKKGHRLKSDIQ